jgi:RNA polymerase sigma-70 factor (ECF subfamily)
MSNPPHDSIQGSAADDTAALYREYGARVSRWASALARNATDADDIVQEVFLIAHLRRPAFDTAAGPCGWLLRTTVNVARHLWRRRRRNARHESSADPRQLPSAAPSPYDTFELRQSAERLDEAVRSLDGRYRHVYSLCEIDRRPCNEVAALTGLNQHTLRVRVYRARRMVAARLRH